MDLKTFQRLVLGFAIIGLCVFVSADLSAQSSPEAIGIFEAHGDIGTVLHQGSAAYDPANKIYSLIGSGMNMWLKEDAFQFVWKKMSGDVSLAADIAFPDKGGNEHKKAALMFRQSLDADSPYVDVALHGAGLTALQFRLSKGDTTHEIQLHAPPKRFRIEKRGDFVYLFAANEGEGLHFSGASIKLPLQGTFYVGIGVCAHDKDAIEKATFSNLQLTSLSPSTATPQLYSTLETVAIASTDRTAVYVASGKFEAPNWTRDGTAFIYNADGRIWLLPMTGGDPEAVNTGSAIHNINDHGISPDGTQLAITDQSEADHHFRVYVMTIGSGIPRAVTGPSSYWHGWSPDGKTLSFVGLRNGDYDVYTIPVAGGAEMRLTTAKGVDDGPDYSPDSKYIYFSSERSGSMQIWRMNADGSNQQQITKDNFQSRFPHVSPDGQWLEFLTYDANVKGHPEDQEVKIRLMSLKNGSIQEIARIFGGEGSINSPSWSQDSKNLAFVNYAYVPAEK